MEHANRVLSHRAEEIQMVAYANARARRNLILALIFTIYSGVVTALLLISWF